VGSLFYLCFFFAEGSLCVGHSFMRYYFYQNEQTLGPFSSEQVRQMKTEGQVSDETPCCQEGDTAWQTVGVYFNAPALPGVVAVSGSSPALAGRFAHSNYLLRRKVFSFLGASFHVYDPQGGLVFFSKQKAFKLREDIRIYADESMTEEVLVIQARQILDFSAAYDVFDPVVQVKVGTFRRKGFSSIFRDTWKVLDAQDQEVGQILEDNVALALFRRFLNNLIPQRFNLQLGDQVVAEYRQRFNPFIFKLEMDFKKSGQSKLDRRMGLAAGVLLASIEGRQG
jgi:uncharacterized protein YxjI